MELYKIEKLLKKYFEASTSVSEEVVLREYFSGEDVAKHLESYAPLFRYYSKEKEERFTKNILTPTSSGSLKILYPIISVAAILLILFGVYFNTNTSVTALEDQFTQEEIAAAQEALSLLSVNFNKGAGQITYLEEFQKNTNRFLDNERKLP